MPYDEPTRKPRLRYSLTSLVLLTTIVAMGITIILLWREVGPLRAEVSRLRSEAGVLVVDDPTKMAAMQVRDLRDLSWAYRVYLPEPGPYTLAWKVNGLPLKGTPPLPATASLNSAHSWGANTHGCGIPAGEHFISIAMQQDNDDRWKVGVEVGESGHSLDKKASHSSWPVGGSHRIRGVIDADADQWPNNTTGQLNTATPSITDTQGEFLPTRPLILLNQRYAYPETHPDGSKSYQLHPPAPEGVMLWIVNNATGPAASP